MKLSKLLVLPFLLVFSGLALASEPVAEFQANGDGDVIVEKNFEFEELKRTVTVINTDRSSGETRVVTVEEDDPFVGDLKIIVDDEPTLISSVFFTFQNFVDQLSGEFNKITLKTDGSMQVNSVSP
ncbi:MAG: hypothetical protein V3V61_07950 [Gammaproteobacteria bacterium]